MNLHRSLILFFVGIALVFLTHTRVLAEETSFAIVGKPIPEFDVPVLGNGGRLTNDDLQGHVSLLNVWASWCGYCRSEHPFLMKIAAAYPILIFGLDFEDQPENAQRLLLATGNPYQKIGLDPLGDLGRAWQVYGTPQTFVIDPQGVIRYRHIGPLDESVWHEKIWPIVQALVGDQTTA